MSQQYYYNNAGQFTNSTTYPNQTQNAVYNATGNAAPLTSTFNTTRSSNVSAYNVTSAHRSSAPVTYTYPTNATVVAPPVAVVPTQQATLVASHPNAGKVAAPTGSYIITNGPSQANNNNNAYAGITNFVNPNSNAYDNLCSVTTSYFQQLPTAQTQMQQQNMALAAAHHAVVAAAARGRRKPFNGRSTGDAQTFYCDVCKVSCAGPQTYKEHLDGQKHKKKAAGTKVPQGSITRSNQRQLRCELCDVTCTGVDAYQAHVRGTKHQKTIKLHQRLGKPIPSSDPVVIKQADSAPTSESASVVISAAPKIKFINKVVKADGSVEYGPLESTSSTTTPAQEERVDINSLQEKNVAPVGGEYIETTKNECGKVVQFYCKLCSCKFNDPHAKEMHLKGRRHRLQYKKKVDPSLVVDAKIANQRSWKAQEDKIRQKQQREESWRRRDMQSRMRDMQRLEYSNMTTPGFHGISQPGMRTFDTLDDKHVMNKHTTICPTEKEIQVMQNIVNGIEKSLRQLSEIVMEDVPQPTTIKINPKEEPIIESEKNKSKEGEKALCGGMRIGALAKGLVLRGDLDVSLVLLCVKWPTKALIRKVMSKLPEKLKEILPCETLEISINEADQCLIIKRNADVSISCTIRLTSSVVREESTEANVNVQPEDGLDRKRCLEALASLRHTKWFQAKVANLQPCVIIIRLLRELCRRVPTWNPLNDWTLELLVEKVVSSESVKLSAGFAIRRFFECLASGLLLAGGPGLKDPCEKELTDATNNLTDQEREDITASAQHALRLIAFRQIHKVLGMDAIPSTNVLPANLTDNNTTNNNVRKRRHSDAEEEIPVNNSLKKDKKEPVKIEKEMIGSQIPTITSLGIKISKDK